MNVTFSAAGRSRWEFRLVSSLVTQTWWSMVVDYLTMRQVLENHCILLLLLSSVTYCDNIMSWPRPLKLSPHSEGWIWVLLAPPNNLESFLILGWSEQTTCSNDPVVWGHYTSNLQFTNWIRVSLISNHDLKSRSVKYRTVHHQVRF